MRIWTRNSALIQPRTSLGKGDVPRPAARCAALRPAPSSALKTARVERSPPFAASARSTSGSQYTDAAAGHDTSLFPRLVLGWINADFRVQTRIFQHFSRPPRKSPSRQQILQIFAIFFQILPKCYQNVAKMLAKSEKTDLTSKFIESNLE